MMKVSRWRNTSGNSDTHDRQPTVDLQKLRSYVLPEKINSVVNVKYVLDGTVHGQKHYCSVRDSVKTRIPPGRKTIVRSLWKRTRIVVNFNVLGDFLTGTNPSH